MRDSDERISRRLAAKATKRRAREGRELAERFADEWQGVFIGPSPLEGPEPAAAETEAALRRFALFEGALCDLLRRIERGEAGPAIVGRVAELKDEMRSLYSNPAFIVAHECICGHGLFAHRGFERRGGPWCHTCIDEMPLFAITSRCGLRRKSS